MARQPMFGERAPDFVVPASNNPRFQFNTAAGRNLILVFLGSPLSPAAESLLAEAATVRAALDDRLAALFYVVSEAEHIDALGLKQAVPGIRYFTDYERVAARAFGLAPDAEAEAGGPAHPPVSPRLVVLDRNLRVVHNGEFVARRPYLVPIVALLRQIDAGQRGQESLSVAPVLVMERIFEPAFCRRLIDYYGQRGGEDSGFMREREGLTVEIMDYGHKRRRDCTIEDPQLYNAAIVRVRERLAPEIKRSFQFAATRIERHIVACYESEVAGYFRPHRDNTTKGTAHRRFAVTINLNAEDYEGGDLRFPEFGDRRYRAPTGGAVVFSCSLLHEALPVTKGKRYAYLPFLYGEAEAELRERNKDFLDVRSGGRAQAAAPAADRLADAPARKG
jgi:hypothetical protein